MCDSGAYEGGGGIYDEEGPGRADTQAGGRGYTQRPAPLPDTDDGNYYPQAQPVPRTMPQAQPNVALPPPQPTGFSYIDALGRQQTNMPNAPLRLMDAGTRIGAVLAGPEAALYAQARQPTPVAQAGREVMTASGPQGSFTNLTNFLASGLGRQAEELTAAVAPGSVDRRALLQSDEAMVGAGLEIDRDRVALEGFGGRLGGNVAVAGEGVHTSDQTDAVSPNPAPDVTPPLQGLPGASVEYAENIIVPTADREEVYGFDPNNPEQVAAKGSGVFGSRINAPRDPRAAGWGNLIRV